MHLQHLYLVSKYSQLLSFYRVSICFFVMAIFFNRQNVSADGVNAARPALQLRRLQSRYRKAQKKKFILVQDYQ